MLGGVGEMKRVERANIRCVHVRRLQKIKSRKKEGLVPVRDHRVVLRISKNPWLIP